MNCSSESPNHGEHAVHAEKQDGSFFLEELLSVFSVFSVVQSLDLDSANAS